MSIYEIAKIVIFFDRLQTNPLVIKYFLNHIDTLNIDQIKWLDFLNNNEIPFDCSYLKEVFNKDVLNNIEYYTYEELDLIVSAIANQYQNIETLCNRDICFAAREAIYHYKLDQNEADESVFTM